MKVDETFDQYWAGRKKKLRYHLRRYHRDLAQNALKPQFRTVSAPAAMATAVDSFGELESAGWKGHKGTAIHRDNPQGAAYRSIMQAFAKDGQSLAHQMFLDGRLVAGWLIVMAGGMAVMIKTTYDESLSHLAVGRVHLYHTLQDLFTREDLELIEFYTNANAAQLEWASISRPIYHANHYRHPALRRGRRLCKGLLTRLRNGPAERPSN